MEKLEQINMMKKMNKKTGAFCAVFDESIGLCEIDQFVDNFRQQADKKDEIVIDLDVSKKGGSLCWKIFLAKHRKKEFYQ